MMSKCANPNCSSVFRYLREGKLFQVPAVTSVQRKGSTPEAHLPPRRDEFFWLCGSCSKELTVAMDSEGAVRIVPRMVARAISAAG